MLFDLSAINKPVIKARLKLYLPGPPDITTVGYISPDPFEPYRISGTPCSEITMVPEPHTAVLALIVLTGQSATRLRSRREPTSWIA